MPILDNQKILKLASDQKTTSSEFFIQEDVTISKNKKLLYYIFINRLVILLAIISLLYSVCASIVVMVLAPRILLDAQIFTEMSDSKSLVKREHINRQMESREKIMVNCIKQYVVLRNTFIRDELEMLKRWQWGGLISYLSNINVYKSFAEWYPSLVKALDKSGASRSVDILDVSRVGGSKSYIWKVEFKTYDFTYGDGDENSYNRKFGPKISEKYWRAHITCTIDPRRRVAYKRLLNPLGFIVVNYSQTDMEN